MKSGWFWGSPMWQEYLDEYAKTRPECLHEWKSSPLANDHDLEDGYLYPGMIFEEHQSQVIDLRMHKWSDVRKSYHSLIHRGQERLLIKEESNITPYRLIHQSAFGVVREPRTFIVQQGWVNNGYAMVVTAEDSEIFAAAALWIIYKECAYYASGPSIIRDAQHAVIWKSLQLLKERGITLVDLGQIDGDTEKEKNIGKFKAGFGGEAKPFTIVRRR